MGTEDGSSFIAMQRNGERIPLVWVPRFSQANEERRECTRYTVLWRLLNLANSRKPEEPRTTSFKID